MRRVVQKLCRSERGAVAPTIALSLTALIAVGGLAFDYARLANLDTELQDAADQAALAAASQLDQKGTSIQRATAAAQSLLTNRTLMANDANVERHGRHHSDRRLLSHQGSTRKTIPTASLTPPTSPTPTSCGSWWPPAARAMR